MGSIHRECRGKSKVKVGVQTHPLIPTRRAQRRRCRGEKKKKEKKKKKNIKKKNLKKNSIELDELISKKKQMHDFASRGIVPRGKVFIPNQQTPTSIMNAPLREPAAQK